jgi:hypothetical protein
MTLTATREKNFQAAKSLREKGSSESENVCLLMARSSRVPVPKDLINPFSAFQAGAECRFFRAKK